MTFQHLLIDLVVVSVPLWLVVEDVVRRRR